jgi:hypothetical protein
LIDDVRFRHGAAGHLCGGMFCRSLGLGISFVLEYES